MNEKKKLLLVVAGVVLVTLLLAVWAPQQPGVMTMAANIEMSTDINTPPLIDGVQTIKLSFSEKLDAKTVAAGVKFYRIDATGNAVSEPGSIAVDPLDAKVIVINNQAVTSLTQGEEYQVVVTADLKSQAGSTLTSPYTGYFATNYATGLAGNGDLNGERTQIHIISDTHLGVSDAFAETQANRQPLVDYLNQIRISPNVKELVIAGDLLDGWFVPMDYILPATQDAFFDAVAANNPTVVAAINAIIQEGIIKVTYVPGNHDLLMTEADVARIFPGINQDRDSVQGLGSYVTGANSEIAIEHGHKYNFFCAPDTISNRDITNNGTSVLPPGYFFTRIATTSAMEGQPKTTNIFPDLTVDKKNRSQLDLYLYAQVWKGMMTALPVTESFAEPAIKTNIDGYTQTYAINDLLPYQNADGTIGVNLFKDCQNTWDARQTANGVPVKISASEAIAQANSNPFTDQQAQTQIFNTDPTKRIVVFGHTHVARIAEMTNGNGDKTIYANSGTWIDSDPGNPTMTFVVITPQKSDSAVETVNLYQYGADQPVTQWVGGQAITQP